MKKFIASLIALTMILGLAACGSTTSSEAPAPETTSAAEELPAEQEPEETSQEEPEEEEPEDVAPEAPEAPAAETYKAGTYKVGEDIEAGEYYVEAGSFCYLEVASDSTGDFDSIISNEAVTGHTFITVEDGQYFKVQGGTFQLAENVPALTPVNDAFGPGTYRVGIDLPAGEYNVVAEEDALLGYYAVYSDSIGTFSSIVSNGTLEAGANAYVTVAEGQYLNVSGASIILK